MFTLRFSCLSSALSLCEVSYTTIQVFPSLPWSIWTQANLDEDSSIYLPKYAL